MVNAGNEWETAESERGIRMIGMMHDRETGGTFAKIYFLEEIAKKMSKKAMVVLICVVLLFVGCVHAGKEEYAGISGSISVNTGENAPITENGNIAEMGGMAEEITDTSGAEAATGILDEEIEGTATATVRSDSAEQDYEQNDAYKLFYGTWEITSIVSKHARIGADEGCEDILGMQVTYLPDRYEFGGIVTVDHPNYLMSIFPSPTSLVSGIYQFGMGDIDIIWDKGYSVWVQIVDMPTGAVDGMEYGYEPYIGKEFLIGDDNTLYCFDYECFYEMKRVSYDEVSEDVVETVPRDHHYEQNSAYKLFYGTWEITDIVSEHRLYGRDEGCEEILGMQVTYLPDRYEFGEIAGVDNPNYMISIFPTDDRFLFDQRQAGMDELLPDREFFVWVQIADEPVLSGHEDGGSYDFASNVGNEFFIKDDNTLYLYANHCIYEMKRVSYMDDYNESMLSYQERW